MNGDFRRHEPTQRPETVGECPSERWVRRTSRNPHRPRSRRPWQRVSNTGASMGIYMQQDHITETLQIGWHISQGSLRSCTSRLASEFPELLDQYLAREVQCRNDPVNRRLPDNAFLQMPETADDSMCSDLCSAESQHRSQLLFKRRSSSPPVRMTCATAENSAFKCAARQESPCVWSENATADTPSWQVGILQRAIRCLIHTPGRSAVDRRDLTHNRWHRLCR